MRRIGFVVMLAILLAALPSAALAQGGGGDRIVVAQQYVLRSGETQDGNLAVLLGSAQLEQGSIVNGDLAVLGSSLRVAGTVRGSVAVFAGSVTLEDNAVIEGDLATFGSSVRREAGAVIRGEVFNAFGSWEGELPIVSPAPVAPVPPAIQVPGAPDASALRVIPPRLGRLLGWQLSTLGWILTLVVLAVVALLVAPKAVAQVATAAAAEPGLSLVVGLLTWVVALAGGAALLICCGLGLLVWLVLLFGLLMGWIALGLWVGQRALQALRVQQASSLGEVVLGVALLTIVARLPLCIGFLFFVLVGSIGLGAVVLTRFGTQPSGTAGRSAAPPELGGGEVGGALPASWGADEPGPTPSPLVVEAPQPQAPDAEMLTGGDVTVESDEGAAGESSPDGELNPREE